MIKYSKINIFFLLAAFLMLPGFAFAAMPTISNVTGTVATGQTLTITGTNMVQEDTANWDSYYKTGTAYGFEGSSFGADGYTSGNGGGTYDSSRKIMGKQSVKFYLANATTCVPNVSASGDAPLSSTSYWMRAYVMYNMPNNVWPDNHLKLFGAQTNTMLAYLQPASYGSPSNQWVATLNGNPYYVSNPSGTFQNNRWYLVEINQTSNTYTVYVDRQQILSQSFSMTGNPVAWEFGIINACTTNSPITNWIDGMALSSSRIYAASTIEISGNGSTWKYQEPVYLSDTSVQFELDLSGLSGTNYQVRVTNNQQQKSATYSLTGGGGGDTTAPAAPSGLTVR